jgi:hypothetical protein
MTIQEEQRQAAERWLEYRRQQELKSGDAKELDQEPPESERDKKRDHGIDDDYGL